MRRIVVLAMLVLSGCATQIHMRDGTVTRGNPRRAADSDTHIDVVQGRTRTRIALQDVSSVRTRGHNFLYGAAALSAISFAGMAGTATAFRRCGDDEDDSDFCGFGIAVLSFPALISLNITTIALFIRGLILRRRDMRAFYRYAPRFGLAW